MESVALEYTILRLLEFNETEGRATPLRDVDLAAATGSTLGDVRRRLEDLKTREFVELQQVAGASYAVTLRYHQPRLRLLAGRLRCFYHVAIVLLTFAFLAPCSARAQSPSAAGDHDDAALVLGEPDFRVLNLPSTLRLPVHGSSFELTHRFNGNLRNGDFGQQASELFGLDRGANISFEYRFGILRHLQVAAARTSFDRTIQMFGKYDAIHQSAANPVSVSGLASIEGPNNFQERYAPALGATVSRTVAQQVAVYATPIWIHNSAAALLVDRDTFYMGIGGRVRIGGSTYVVAEITPRLAGYAPGDAEFGFGIEKRYGAHVFQLTFANTQGTTFGQLARGGSPETLYLGFNLTRKFF